MAQAIVQSSWAKLTYAIGDGVARRLDVTGDLGEMLEALEVVKPLLEEAERRSFRKEALRIRTAAHRISDLVDELQGTRAPAAGMARRTLPCLAVVPKKNTMANKMKDITDELRKIHQEFAGSDSASLEQVTDIRETTPKVDESMILGRDKAKKRIMAVLSGSIIMEGPIILPIFGLEGIGKTALAQTIFNNTQFRKYNFRAWIHVSHKFDLLKIAKSMLFLASGEENPGSDGMEYIVNRLRDLYHGMKVLIVLDDLCEEDTNKLERLKSMLSIGGSKVSVIVTTRSQRIARTICTVKPHMVNPLSNGDCWTIIKQTSDFEFRNEFEKQELKPIGRRIARKCAGQPSAAQELGSILRDGDVETWSVTMNSDVWNDNVTGMPPCLDILSKKIPKARQMKTMKTKLRMIKDELNGPLSYRSQQEASPHQDIDLPKTTPQLEKKKILGRGQDEQSIMATLSASNIREGPIVLPIFGLGGIGKTTLARIVFNAAQFKKYNFRVWIHASLKCDLLNIGRSMLFHASGEECHDSTEMEYIRTRLHDIYYGMKALIVLDGLWDLDSNKLKDLKSFLSSVDDKSTELIVIVTTCSAGLAREISTVKPHRLNPLHDSMCWEIIKQTIDIKDGSNKEEIGQKLASKCGGLPSAVLVLGNILRSKDVVGWSAMMNNDIWSDISSSFGGTRFFELSYRSMSPYLKLCFAYCAVFPKGRSIVKNDLIHQWIVLHLVEPSEEVSIAQRAEEYIRFLLDISFIQPTRSTLTSGNPEKGEILFTMHDLVHNFAVALCEVLIISGDGNGISDRDKYCLYARLHRLDVSPLKLYSILPTQLRALCCHKINLSDDLVLFPSSLRVFELKDSPMHKLPHSICRLKHLGYLNLSGCSQLVSLPESFGDLTDLMHINLSGCSRLLHLPESLGNILSLSHVNLSSCHGLVNLPGSLRKLKNLIHLDLSFWSCFEGIPVIGDLTSLEHLNLSHPCCYLAQHSLHLSEVLCKLTKLQYLNLSMCLNPILYYLSEEESLRYIMSCFRSLSNLKQLDLSHNIFLSDLPEIRGGLTKLNTLDLSGCIRLKRVHGWIGGMDFLNLVNCSGLESCHFVVHTDGSKSSSLAQLEDVNCKELDIICLERVKSIEEVKRIRLAEKQKLQQLKLHWSVSSQGSLEDNALLGELVPPHSVERLELQGYNGETCLPAWWTSSILPNLVEVTLDDFPSCRSLPPLGLLPNLKCVFLRKLANITRIDAGDLSGGSRAAFRRLTKFTLDEMQCLEEFNTTYLTGGEEFMFPVLYELLIQKCPQLSFGPYPPRAQRLIISVSDCHQVSWQNRQAVHDVEGPSPSAPVTQLVIENCDVPLPDWSLLQHLPGLQSLILRSCDNLISEENNSDYLTTCSPEMIQILSSLRSLCFSHCGITEIPQEYLGHHISLRELAIDGCKSIKSLPESIHQLINLKVLYIWDCPDLRTWCESAPNKKMLARVGPKYEKFAPAMPDEQPPQSQTESFFCFIGKERIS